MENLGENCYAQVKKVAMEMFREIFW